MLAWLSFMRALGGILRSSQAPKRLLEKGAAVLAGSVLVEVDLEKAFKLSAYDTTSTLPNSF